MKQFLYFRLFFALFLLLVAMPKCFIYSQNPTFSINNSVACVNQQLCFTNTSPSGVFSEFYWDFNGDNGSDGTEVENGTTCFAYSNYYLGNVFLWGKRISDGIWTAGLQSIKVFAPNTPSLSLAQTDICEIDAVLTNTSPLSDDGSTHLTYWDFGDGTNSGWTNSLTINHTYNASGVYQIVMKDQNSCGIRDSTVSNITVTMLNPAIAVSPDNTICQGEMVGFSDSSQTNQSVLFNWNFGDGSTSNQRSPNYMYLTNGSFTIKLVESIPSQCADSVETIYNVLPGPIAEFSASEPTQCDNADIIYTDESIVDINDVYSWDFGNGISTLTTPIQYDSAGYYYPNLTISRPSNNCVSVFNDTILIPKTPITSFSANKVCLNDITQFSDLTSNGIPSLYTYSWDFGGDGIDSVPSPTHIFTSPGSKDITLVVENGYCTDDTTITVVVEDLPHPDFTLDFYKGCAPLQIQTTNITPDGVYYEWIFGSQGTSQSADTVFTFQNPTLHDSVSQVTLIASTEFGCEASKLTNVKVFYSPSAQFNSDIPPIPVCYPTTASFWSTTIEPINLIWNFGDNSPLESDSSTTHTYENQDNYFKYFQVFLVAVTDSGCRDTSQIQYVTLNPRPRTDFVMDTVSTCHPASIGFNAPPEFNANYIWIFQPGDTIRTTDILTNQILTNSGNDDTTYIITLISENQFECLDTASQSITIHPKPDANFSMSPNPSNTNEVVNFTNLTGNNPGWQYNWLFDAGDTTTFSGYTPTPQGFDTYYDVGVTLFVNSEFDCKDTAINILEIIPPPPLLNFIPDTLNGCPPVTITFTDSSEFMDTTTYLWDFGDGHYSTEVNPVHTFYISGITMVTLTANSLLDSTMTKDTLVNIFEIPSPAFSFNPLKPYIPDQPVKCVPEYPADNLTYLWDFGDGITDTAEAPVHFYQDTGSFSILFVVTNDVGCVDSLRKDGEALGAGKFNAPNVFFPNSSGGGGGGGGGGNGDGAYIDPSSQDNSAFAPLSEGVLEYHLEIFNRWGERLFSSDQKDYGWTGYYRQKLCKEDVYVWKASGIFSNGEAFVKTGTITLIHNDQ